MHDVRAAMAQAWPPFVLVAGLLMVGAVAHAEGLFDRAGSLVAGLPGPPVAVLAACMGLVAVVTATMNLDTAVVFLTPVLILVARRRAVDERPFLYAVLFMANASSLFLPGANLTNLLVLGNTPVDGGFAAAFFLPALVACLVTAVGILLLLRPRATAPDASAAAAEPAPHRTTGRRPITALLAVAVAGALTIGLHDPALAVLATGLAAGAVACVRRSTTPATLVRAVGPLVLLGLFALSVALGVVARAWDGPSDLIATADAWETLAVAAVAAVTVNNLPAAVLLSADHVPHARALLIGLNLGPNLAVTGSLSSYLWWRAARQVGASPSIRTVTRLGLILAPAAAILAMLTLSLGAAW